MTFDDDFMHVFNFFYRENLPKPVTYFTLPLTDTLDSEKTQEARLNYPGGVTNVEVSRENIFMNKKTIFYLSLFE